MKEVLWFYESPEGGNGMVEVQVNIVGVNFKRFNKI